MKMKYIIYGLLAAVLVYLIYKRIVGDKENSGGKSSEKTSANGPINVQGIVIATQDFSNEISISGSIDANEQVQIRSEISGLIRSINFTEGAEISKGSLILRIDDSELQAQLSQALTKQKLADEVEDRAAKLLKSEAISQEEYDNTKAELRTLQAQTQLIKAQLTKTEIRAPFSGKIGLRNISSGAYITPTTNIAQLVNTQVVKITFSVPEKYAQLVKMGQKVNFNVAGSSKNYVAEVYAKEPAIDVATRTLVLRAKANNSDGSLLPGTFANINLTLQNIKNAILVPSEAVIPVLKGKQVYVSRNGLAQTVAVQSDIRTDKDILVTKGLEVGDTVITTGIMVIKPNATVKVKISSSKN